MATLKPVGISDDGTEVILARRAAGKGSFRVKIDDALVEQLVAARDVVFAERDETQAAVPKPKQPPPESKLSIKEIQSLLRQGRSVEAIARKAGVDPHWIERWESPIVWERAGIAARAQRATLARSRRGPSGLPLGEAVEANLRRRKVGIDPATWADSWDSVRDPRGNSWTVRFTFTSRGRPRVAEWRYDVDSEEVTAKNELASELGWVEPRRRRRRD